MKHQWDAGAVPAPRFMAPEQHPSLQNAGGSQEELLDGEIQAKPPEQLRDLGCLHGGCSLVTFHPDLNLTLHLVGSKIPPFTKSQGLWAISVLDGKTESDSSEEVRHKLRE